MGVGGLRSKVGGVSVVDAEGRAQSNMEQSSGRFRARPSARPSTSIGGPGTKEKTARTKQNGGEGKLIRISSGVFPQDLVERIRVLRSARYLKQQREQGIADEESIEAVVVAVVRAGLGVLEREAELIGA